MIPQVRIIVGDCTAGLHRLPDTSAHCVVTSPPYWKIRTYDADKQLGHEETVDEYIESIVSVAREIRRVMRSDASFWLNIGDCYVGKARLGCSPDPQKPTSRLKYKQAMLIPFRLALALQDDGWWVRADCIWEKRNSTPENVPDRPNKNHEYIFLLTKTDSCYYDGYAVRQWGKTTTGKFSDHNLRTVWNILTESSRHNHPAPFPEKLPQLCIMAGTSKAGCCPYCGAQWTRKLLRMKNKDREASPGDPLRDRHCLQGPSGKLDTVKSVGWEPACRCPEHEPVPATVLDPFGGSGTTGLVAAELGRNAVLIEISQHYVNTAFKRIRDSVRVKSKVVVEHVVSP